MDNFYKNREVLITGGAGFIGRNGSTSDDC
jgi:nucleoside-diphosphate-sugar epimerase